MDHSESNNIEGWAITHTDCAIYQDIKERARAMLKNLRPAEETLWQRLRRKQIKGFHFRRQHPVDRFIVDFYCAAARLVIEVDGSIHDMPEQADYDGDRQMFLEHAGLNCCVLAIRRCFARQMRLLR